MLNCKQATKLLSEGMDRRLGLLERARLRAHLAFCEGCRNFRRQVEFLRQASRYFAQRDDKE